MKSRTTRAVPKINLILKIEGRRGDGFHDISTVFLPLDSPTDEVEISTAEKGIEIESDSDAVPLDGRNLCHKAAALFAEKAGISPEWKIRIAKNIPVAAGLGGGSADAAAVLNLLNEALGGPLSDAELAETALEIGSDVPFLLNPRPAVGRGRGEKLEPLETTRAIHAVVLNPKFPVSTRWAYGNAVPTGVPFPDPAEIARAIDSMDFRPLTIPSGDAAGILQNDLAPAVFRKFPIMGMLSDALGKTAPAAVGMSGSGPTIFALYPDRASAETAASAVEDGFQRAAALFLSRITPKRTPFRDRAY